MTSEDLGAILACLKSERERLEDFYRDLHAHPELPHQETRTAAHVAKWLVEAGVEVHEQVGGTGVVAVLRNGEGPTVLMRADMDALPVREATGLDYASTVTAVDATGTEVPVMHACGHDLHVTCLVGALSLLALSPSSWTGTVVGIFQPAEEQGDGAARMVADGLRELVPVPDVALCQHVLARPAGTLATREGPVFSAADSMRITLHGRGGHGAMPHATVDPVVLASMIVVRLQAVVSREIAPTSPTVVTVGSLHAGSRSNIIADQAVIELNVRTYDDTTRERVLGAIERIVRAECRASGSPRDPEIEIFDSYPVTANDATVTARVAAAFTEHFGEAAGPLPLQSASEDFSVLPDAWGTPYTYWGVGGIDPEVYAAAERAGRVDEDIPVNHSPTFAPALQPTLDTGVAALVTAGLAWLGHDAAQRHVTPQH